MAHPLYLKLKETLVEYNPLEFDISDLRSRIRRMIVMTWDIMLVVLIKYCCPILKLAIPPWSAFIEDAD